MFSVYLTTLVVIAVAVGFKYLAFEPVGEDTSRRVLFKENLNDLPIYAHRGGGHDAPENTIAAIREVTYLYFTGL